MARSIHPRAFRDFFRSESSGGVLLIFCVAISLVLANSPLGPGLSRMLAFPLGFDNGAVHLRYSVLTWINDGLMAIFFLLIGLEIKRELVEGELSSPAKAALPVIAAFGGAIVPAIIFYNINAGTAAAGGWGIPMATDIAFALAVLSLLGKRIPSSLKIFLATLAIADDLIAILVIALFYSTELHMFNLVYAGGLLLLMVVFNRLNIRSLWAYLVPGLFVWYFIHHSGIHATIAGVVTAFAIPTTAGAEESPLERLERYLHKPVNFLIMPLFALANTNIGFENASPDMLTDGLGLGIILGLLVGKPVGITLSTWITVKLRLSKLPTGAHWGHIAGIGILGGIGFTMSIFISLLSFGDVHMQNAAKFTILITSSVAGLVGYIFLSMLRKTGRKNGS